MSNGSYSEKASKENRLLCSGALGISVVAVVQLLQLSSLDTPLVVALYAFAAAIPLTAMVVYVTTLEIDNQAAAKPEWLFLVLTLLGLVVSLVGVGALFFHFDFIQCAGYIGWTFIGVSALTIVLGFIFKTTTG